MSRDDQLHKMKASPAPSDWADSLHEEALPLQAVKQSTADFSRSRIQHSQDVDFSSKSKHKRSTSLKDTHNTDDRIVLEDPRLELKQSITKTARKTLFLLKQTCRNIYGWFMRTSRLLLRTARTYPKHAIVTGVLILLPVSLIVVAQISRNNTSKQAATSDVLGEKIERGAGRTVFYPTTLPRGYSISNQQGQAVANNLVSSYTISNGRATIVVSQQDYMPQEAFDSLFKGGEKIETSLGNAFLVLEGENTKLGGVRLSDGRTIILNASYPLDRSTLSLILLSLQPKK